MKKVSAIVAALVLIVTGCHKNLQTVGNGGEEVAAGQEVYMEFKIQAVNTRSGSDEDRWDKDQQMNSDATPDYEVGKDYENEISSIDVVLRNEKKFVVASQVTPTLKENVWVATFSSGNLATGEKYDVYIYANCNASQDLNAKSSASIADITKIETVDGKKTGKFWMTNAYQAQNIVIGELSNNEKEPTNLGSHFVERCMARFDYMAVNAGNVYELTEGNDGVKVTLTDAAIINQSKEFYMLRRAYPMGNSGDVTIGYPETATNFVIDTDWAEKTANYKTPNTIKSHYDCPLDGANWNWVPLNTLTEDDSWTGTDGGASGITPPSHSNYDGYKIFGYAKENTPPSVEAQVNGLSTGVVFRGTLSGDIIDNAHGEAIYAFDGVLYGTWNDIKALENKSEALQHYVNQFGDEILEDELEDLGKAGFTRFTVTGDKYYVYYYYWNRHRDNQDNTSMGEMEFAVVRNNVYKLCVDRIEKLGRPEPGEKVDPDPVQPGDPNETGEYYFGVSVQVVPWVVRVNHIGW